MSDSNDEKLALTPKEFAALFGKSQTWGYRQLYAGKVKALTGYGRVLIPASEAKRVLAEAGRYNGATSSVKETEQEPEGNTAKKQNSWREGIKNRRNQSAQTPGSDTRSKSIEQAAARKSAMRKLNRSAK